MNLAEAKTRLNIHYLWRHFGFEGTPSKNCRCPFHRDATASFSVFKGKDGLDAFNCFAGCGGGDVVDFYALATRRTKREACIEFIRLAGGTLSFADPRLILPKTPDSRDEEDKKRLRATWSPLESHNNGITDERMEQLAKLRHGSLEGVQLMVARGLLRFAEWKGKPAWFVTDSTRLNAQVRRMDGKPWEGINAKAQTLPGSIASWPIGAKESARYPFVILCEGGPDLLAAHYYIHLHGREGDTAAVAMMGASYKIHADALPQFADRNISDCYPVEWPEPGEPVQFVCKHVRIFAHADDPGRAAAKRWAEQLKGYCTRVDAIDFPGLWMADGKKVKDLNDCNQIDPKQNLELENLLPHETIYRA